MMGVTARDAFGAAGFPELPETKNRGAMRSRHKNTLAVAMAFGALTLVCSASASAAIITYDVDLTFDPNATPESSLGAAGPGTVEGTLTINTNLSNPVTGNLMAVDLVEKSNNGTILSVFTNSPTETYNTITPYTVFFIGSPVTEYPAQSSLFSHYGTPAEIVSLSSQPVFDSIQVGPSIQFDFPYSAGGSVWSGNFDSIASTGFNAYLYGTVTPATSSVPEPSSWALAVAGVGLLGGTLRSGRRRGWAAA